MAERVEVLRRIAEILLADPGMSAAAITAELGEYGVTKTSVNGYLYGRQDIFEQHDDRPPVWAVRPEAVPIVESWRAEAADASSRSRTCYAGPELRDWQREALDAWESDGHRGVIESVTGTGKTLAGVAAAAIARDHGHRVIVVVPGADEQARWIRALRESLPDQRIGGLGGPAGAAPVDGDVLVVTAYAAVQVRLTESPDAATALIVDDVQAYSAGSYAKALLDEFTWRLGLTATAERHDDRFEKIVLPYFGKVIPGCDYARAVTDGLLPPVRVAQVEVRLTEREARRLDQIEGRLEQAVDTLVGTYGAPETPRRALDDYAQLLANANGPSARVAKRYLDHVAERTALLADCEQKIELVRHLPVQVLARTQSVFFTDRASSAGQITQILSEAGLGIARVGSGLTPSQRAAIVERLRNGDLRAVAESRILDDSVPVPNAGVGVILAAGRSDRQMVHRIGRIVHPGAALPAVFVVAFVRGTPEDPNLGAAESRLPVLWAIAEEVVTTDTAGLPAILDRWLAPTSELRSSTTHSDSQAAAHPPSLAVGTRRPAVTAPVATAATTVHPEPAVAQSITDEEDDVITELDTGLSAQGGIATADELGDLIGLTDPDEMSATVAAAAAQGLLHFRATEDGSGELLLLSAAAGGTAHQRDHALAAIDAWVRTTDPLGEFHQLVSGLGSVRVPAHRLVQIAAFLRGVTPTALL